jgi:zinc transport system ATP-binding protein
VDLRIGYGDRALLPPIDLEICRGEFWVVLGRNGSGKTTWFKTALGLIQPVGGRVVSPQPQARFAYVAQRSTFDDLYPVRVGQVVAMGRQRGAGPWRSAGSASGGHVDAALSAVDALELKHRSFRSLSEGQKQRVLLARTAASGADLAFLDEPTASMDAVAEAEAMALLNRLRLDFGMAVVVVSHHLSVARQLAERALYVDDDNHRVLVGEAGEVFADPAFRSRYGSAVDSPLPDLAAESLDTSEEPLA